MYCENCGARIDDDSAFCENCGVLIKEESHNITDLDQLMGIDLKPDAEEEAEIVTNIADKDLSRKETLSNIDGLMKFDKMEDSKPKSPVKTTAVKEEVEPEPMVEIEMPVAAEPEYISVEQDLEAGAITDPEDGEGSLDSGKEEGIQGEPDELKTGNGDAKTQALYCMACGRMLPQGAAFCDACGTPTGEVAPVEIHKRKLDQGVFVDLVKGFFIKPGATIEKAASEDAFLPGITYLLIKDVILAVLAAVFMTRLSASLGFLGAWLMGGDAFGFGARAFLIAVGLDALWLGILYGLSVLFKGSGTLKELTGACGVASLLTAALLVLTLLLTAFVPTAAICAGLVTAAALVAATMKAITASMELDDDKTIYMVTAAAAGYSIILFLLITLI